MTNILFLCTGNSCRSQMAEGWAKSILSKEYTINSAGIEAHGVNPHAITVMKEAGIDISKNTSQLLSDLPLLEWHVVITVCDSAKEICPFIPGSHITLHYSFDDPPTLAKQLDYDVALDIYRRVRDEIRECVAYIPSLLLEEREQ